MFIRKIEGEYKLCRRKGAFTQSKKGKATNYYDWFTIKNNGNGECGWIEIRKGITFPKELLGKRVKIIVKEINSC